MHIVCALVACVLGEMEGPVRDRAGSDHSSRDTTGFTCMCLMRAAEERLLLTAGEEVRYSHIRSFTFFVPVRAFPCVTLRSAPRTASLPCATGMLASPSLSFPCFNGLRVSPHTDTLARGELAVTIARAFFYSASPFLLPKQGLIRTKHGHPSAGLHMTRTPLSRSAPSPPSGPTTRSWPMSAPPQ